MHHLADIVRRHHEPVSRGEFRLFAVCILVTAMAISAVSTYSNVVNDSRFCAALGICESWSGPSVRGPLQVPNSSPALPGRLGAEKRSWRRG